MIKKYTQNLLLIFVSLLVSHAADAAKHIIFVPGFGGTELVNSETNETLWPSISELLWGHALVTLPIKGLNLKVPLIRLGKVVSSVGIGPIKRDIYAKPMESLREIARNNNATFHAVKYDWRREPFVGVMAISALVKSLNLGPQDEVYFFAHSYGGLILSFYLRYGAQLDTNPDIKEDWSGSQNVKAAMVLGAPFGGTAEIYKAIREGVKHLYSSAMFTPFQNGTFPASYFLLPTTDRARTETYVGLSVFNQSDISNWKNLKLGLFNGKECYLNSSTLATCENFTNYWLNRSKKFQQLLFAPSSSKPNSIQIYFVKGSGNLETPSIAIFPIEKSAPVYFQNTVGDGLARLSQAVPDWLKSDTSHLISLKKDHFEILTDKTVLTEFNRLLKD